MARDPVAVAAQNRAYYAANREKLLARQRAYYEANRDKILVRASVVGRAYYEANREKVLARQRAYREANREDVLARRRAYEVFRGPLRRLERRIGEKLDLIHQLEAQLGLTPQQEVSP